MIIRGVDARLEDLPVAPFPLPELSLLSISRLIDAAGNGIRERGAAGQEESNSVFLQLLSHLLSAILSTRTIQGKQCAAFGEKPPTSTNYGNTQPLTVTVRLPKGLVFTMNAVQPRRMAIDSLPRSALSGGGGTDVWNWSRTLRIGPSSAVSSPRSEVEIQQLLRRKDITHVKVFGSKLSYGSLLTLDDSNGNGCLVELSQLRGLVSSTDTTVSFAAGTTLEEVFETLKRMGRMLPCSPGVIAKQSLAGAMATGTHGQGLGQSTLSDVVTNFRVVLANGQVIEVGRQSPFFGAMQLSLGRKSCVG